MDVNRSRPRVPLPQQFVREQRQRMVRNAVGLTVVAFWLVRCCSALGL